MAGLTRRYVAPNDFFISLLTTFREGWKLQGGTGTPACAICKEGISLEHRQECLCHLPATACQRRDKREPISPVIGRPDFESLIGGGTVKTLYLFLYACVPDHFH